MTRVTFDETTLARIVPFDDLVEVCNESGQTVGYFHPIARDSTTPQVKTPFSREEIEKRRAQRTGRPLAEILKDLPK